MAWLYILLCMLCLCLVLCLPLKVSLVCQLKNKQLELSIVIMVYRLQIYRKTWDHDFKKTAEKEQPQSDSQDTYIDILKQLPRMHKKWLNLLHKVHIQKLTWHSNIGMADAHQTAIVVGSAWSVKLITMFYVRRSSKRCVQPSMQITPHFNTYKLETDIACMASIKVGQAIISVMKA